MKKIIAVLTFALLFTACKKQEALGPDIDGIYGPVTVTQPFSANTTSVNFTTGEKVFFNASFQNDAVWIITITGATSNAVKTIRGIGKTINVDNSTWDGSADSPPSFRVENVIAKLSFQNTPDVFTAAPIAITGKYVSGSSTDVLVSDFVVNKQFCYCAGPIPLANWPSDFAPTINTHTTYGFPDGNAYEFMGPQAPWQGAGSPYVDILIFSPRNSMVNYGTYFPLYADPTKVYFNMMVYNTGTPTWLQITCYEDEVPARHIDIKPNWTGWKLVSVKYSDFVANSSDFAANIQPQKISKLQLVMLSNVPVTSPDLMTTDVTTAFDHIIFTHNTPYQP